MSNHGKLWISIWHIQFQLRPALTARDSESCRAEKKQKLVRLVVVVVVVPFGFVLL